MSRLIDADALKQTIEIWREQLVDTYGINDEYVKCLGSVIDYIDDVLTEDERQKGKWIERWNGHFKTNVPRCSLCSNASPFKYNYCPTCGADMRGDENDN